VNKPYTVWICLIVIALLLPACGRESVDPDCTQLEIFCIGLVTEDGGTIDDHSINQAAWEGLQDAQTKLGVIIAYIETRDWRDYRKNISTFGDAGYDVIFTVGPNLAGETIVAAQQYSQVTFVGIDQPKPENSIPNLISITFLTDQAGYMAGALAALMTKSQVIGGVFASDNLPDVWRLGEGYRAGAKSINPEIQVEVVYHSGVSTEGEETAEEILPGQDTHSDPKWGATQAATLVEKGADIVFAGGDETGNAALIEAVQRGVRVIGFGDDQFFTLPEARDGMLTSIVKRVAPLVFIMVKGIRDGDKYDNLKGLYEDLNALGYGEDFLNWNTFLKGALEYGPFHEFESEVSDEVRVRLEEVRTGLIDQTITTGVPLAKPGPVPAPTEAAVTPEP